MHSFWSCALRALIPPALKEEMSVFTGLSKQCCHIHLEYTETLKCARFPAFFSFKPQGVSDCFFLYCALLERGECCVAP